MYYNAKITKEGTSTLAEFPDCPGCQTFVDKDEAGGVRKAAKEALEGWLESLLDHGEAPPFPFYKTGTPIRIYANLESRLLARWLEAIADAIKQR